MNKPKNKQQKSMYDERKRIEEPVWRTYKCKFSFRSTTSSLFKVDALRRFFLLIRKSKKKKNQKLSSAFKRLRKIKIGKLNAKKKIESFARESKNQLRKNIKIKKSIIKNFDCINWKSSKRKYEWNYGYQTATSLSPRILQTTNAAKDPR